MSFEKCHNLLIVDDDPKISDLLAIVAKGNNPIKTSNFADSREEFEKNEIALIICDYILDNESGIDILEWVKIHYPMTRRVLITGHLEVDVAVDAINKADIQKVITKPFKIAEMKGVINAYINEYNEKKFEQYNVNLMRNKLDNLPETTSRQTDELLELLLDITETDEIPNFSNHFVRALEGLKSLAILNAQIYFENQSPSTFNHLLQYLSDIEVIANQYDQKILYLYILSLRSYFFLYDQDIERSLEFHTASKALLHWLQAQNLDPLLLEAIEDFPSNLNKEMLTKPEIRPMIEMQISKLLSIDTGDLVGISESLFQYYQFSKPSILYFIIVRDEFPVYERASENTEIEGGLISGFVVALSKFLEEVAKGTGDIETINHENGVILFHSQENFNFVLFTSDDDVSHRIGLRQIAFESYPILKSIPQGYTTSQDEKKKIDDMVERLLGAF